MSVVKFSEVAHRANTKEDRFNTDKIYYVGGEHIEPGELFIHDKGFIKALQLDQCFIVDLNQDRSYLLHATLI